MKELRKVIIYGKPFQNMTDLVKNLSKDEVKTIINFYPRNTYSHLTLLNLSLTYDKTPDRKYTKFLLENGANPNLEFKQTSSEMIQKTMTPIMFESKIGNSENVDLLIKYGADVYKKDNNGKNSLDHAIEARNDSVIKKLKKKKRKDCSKIRNAIFDVSHLNYDCVKNILSFCF
jgi:hypothetical protein